MGHWPSSGVLGFLVGAGIDHLEGFLGFLLRVELLDPWGASSGRMQGNFDPLCSSVVSLQHHIETPQDLLVLGV